jgi:phospholipase A1
VITGKESAMKKRFWCIGLCSLLVNLNIYADSYNTCLINKMKDAISSMTVGEIKEACLAEQSANKDIPAAEIISNTDVIVDSDGQPVSSAKARLIRERETAWSPHVLTAHKQNYILPYTHTDKINPIYQLTGDEKLEDKEEAKFQISIKVPLVESDIFVEGDRLDFGFTLKSFWQVYNNELSAPFRETNYNPELFYTMPTDFKPQGADTAVRFGIEHESNGRTQLLSRSWNRVYTQFFYAKDNYLISFKPWYRIPEKDKDNPRDADGDDNPDIDDYMGYFELNGVATYEKLEFSSLIRNNLRGDNRGAVELGMSFPFCFDGCDRIRGYVQYFNGYGESLIDYNHRVERIGIGFLITDIM